MGNWNSEC